MVTHAFTHNTAMRPDTQRTKRGAFSLPANRMERGGL
nr:MAG TPA: hypothetical protein [Bacteriophage sp.]